VPVTINNQLTLKFVVDSGASDVSIPTDVVSTLVRTGTITAADFLGSQTYKLADGSTVPSQRFQIRSLKVGNRTLENVTANIEPVAGQLLLGQSFLRRFKSWSIDNARSALILNGDPTPADGSQPEEPSLSGLVASPGSE
jgi:predicted aspartyl protease